MSDNVAHVVRSAVAPVLAGLGCTCYDVEITGRGAGRTVRVLVDRDGGVDLETITAVTQAVSPVLDDTPALGTGPYLLEVSSPGIERPLRTPDHYRGAIGAEVSVRYHTAEGPRRVRGVLADAGDTHCVVAVDGAREEISYTNVTQARTVFEWGPQPRPGPSRPRAKERT
ncbi:MAG: ribosome maturation factor RimP [Actinomycetota bacterium]